MSAAPWAGRRLHFVAIGGAGMSGLALIAAHLGASVTGSDRSESAYLRPVRAVGIDPVIGDHHAGSVPAGAEVVFSSAIPEANPEREVARGPGGGGELHRSELLAEITALKRLIAVTGTHGKTTTTAMITHILRGCGLDPSYVVGAELRATGLNAEWGGGEWMVIEADESDRSLLNFDPEIALLTNAELDHHATYGSLTDLEATFAEFMARASVDVVWDRPSLRALCSAVTVETYDVSDVVLSPEGSRFDWRGHDVILGVPGAHYALNAAGALTAAVAAGADAGQAVATLTSFQGAKRRLERLGRTRAGATVLDSYAHHPTEIAADLAAAGSLGARRVVAVFQPHLYSRTRALADDLGRALAVADVCGVLDIYPSRERAEDFPGVNGRLVAVAAADARAGRPVAWMPTQEDAQRWLDTVLGEDDLCLVMGAGNIDALGRALVAA